MIKLFAYCYALNKGENLMDDTIRIIAAAVILAASMTYDIIKNKHKSG
ncbi:MAG: hypothetical protein R6W90_06355 [Ignavibacteriaceae bacterium]